MNCCSLLGPEIVCSAVYLSLMVFMLVVTCRGPYVTPNASKVSLEVLNSSAT